MSCAYKENRTLALLAPAEHHSTAMVNIQNVHLLYMPFKAEIYLRFRTSFKGVGCGSGI